MPRRPRTPVRKPPAVQSGSAKSEKITRLLHEGLSLHRQGRLASAKQIYEQILQEQSNNFDALQLLATIYSQVNQHEVSLLIFDKALQVNKTDAALFNNRGNALKELKRFHDALSSYNEALSIKPDYAEALNNRGNALKELKRLNDALSSYNEAIRIKPDYAEALNNRGVALKELELFDDALASYDQALRIKPDYAEALYNRGNAFHELKRFNDALSSYDEALRINPNYAEATFNKSVLLILTGDYLDGWMLYEARLELEKKETKEKYPRFSQLAWRGKENIQGKKILICGEQGLGDSIQFVRYLEKIHLLGAEIILEVPETLVNLVDTIKTPITVIQKGHKLPEFDAHCPLLSLPYVFKTTVDTIPSVVPYLYADRQRVSEWNSRLGVKTRKRIGLVWSGAAGHKNDHNRSIPVEIFEDLLKLPIEWHSLQKEYRTDDKVFLDSHPEVKQHQDELGDFTDTAALIECMDAVVSVDTSVAHLAGALGKTTWVLLPFMPDYRWMLDREDCPWYPTAKLIRQDDERDWNKVILELSTRL